MRRLGPYAVPGHYTVEVLEGLRNLPDESIHCCVTSPPYWGLRSYLPKEDLSKGVELGAEKTPEEYVSRMVEIFREVRRVLRSDGTLWLNLGDCYSVGMSNLVDCLNSVLKDCLVFGPNINFMKQPVSFRNGALPFSCLLRDFKVTQASEQKVTFTSVKGGVDFAVSDVRHLWFSFEDGCVVPYSVVYDKASKMLRRSCAKQELGIPDRVKVALQEDGWICRQTIIWQKPNPLPEPVTDRCTKAHEYLFLLSKQGRYFFDHHAIKEPATGGHPAGNKANCYVEAYKEGDEHFRTKMGLLDLSCVPWSTRNRRSVWTIPTRPYRGSHYATYPTKLIEPCILAGCPSHTCLQCGKPWKRVLVKPEMLEVEDSDLDRYGTGDVGVHRKVGQAYQAWRDANPDKDLGLQPSCSCLGDLLSEPGIVLDPFMGSGTTAQVAQTHEREWLGFDLDVRNEELVKERTWLGEVSDLFM